MPLLSIETNHALPPDAADALLVAASRRLAELLGKPERYVMVRLTHNPLMRFGGSAAPLAYLECKSLGLPEQRTAELSAALCELLADHAAIPAARIYIEFAAPQRHLWGYDGATF